MEEECLEETNKKPLVSSFNLETAMWVIKPSFLLLVIIAIFFQDLKIVFTDALNNDTTNYIIVIPFILAYLIYRKRKILRATISKKNNEYLMVIAGFTLSIVALLLYWYGSYTFTPLEYHLSALPILTAGLTLILFNPATLRQLIFPIIFLAFLIPPPSQILSGLGSTLSIFSSEISYAIVNGIGIPSTLTSEYGTPLIMITRSSGATISFSIDVACSGVYSLIGFFVFVIFIAYLIRDKPWKKIALFLIGLPIIYAFNIVRISAILLIGYQYGEALALQMFHLLGGWALIFLGTLLLLAVSEKFLKLQLFSKTTKCPKYNSHAKMEGAFCPKCGRIINPRTPQLTRNDIIKIITIILSVILITSIQAPVVALTQNPTLIINTPSGQQTPTTILPQIKDYELNFLYRDKTFEERANQDMAVAYLYNPVNQTEMPIYVTIEIASTLSSLHRWENCLMKWPIKHGFQARVTQIQLKDQQLIDNPPLIGRYFVFESHATNVTQAVLYWYETATFIVNSTSQQKHVKISMIVYPDNLENLTLIESQLLKNAKTVAKTWQPIKTWSAMAIFLSQNGNILLTIPITLLVGIALFCSYNKRKQKRRNFQTYKKLSKPNQQVIQTILETQKTTIPTLNAILTTYKNKTGKSIDEKELLQRIIEIKKTGIIKSEIANNQDIPKQIWKSNTSS